MDFPGDADALPSSRNLPSTIIIPHSFTHSLLFIRQQQLGVMASHFGQRSSPQTMTDGFCHPSVLESQQRPYFHLVCFSR